jgi:hypothetical protein
MKARGHYKYEYFNGDNNSVGNFRRADDQPLKPVIRDYRWCQRTLRLADLVDSRLKWNAGVWNAMYSWFGAADGLQTRSWPHLVNHFRDTVKHFRVLKCLTYLASTVDHQRQPWLINQPHRLPSATPCLAEFRSAQRTHRLKRLIISYTGQRSIGSADQCHVWIICRIVYLGIWLSISEIGIGSLLLKGLPCLKISPYRYIALSLPSPSNALNLNMFTRTWLPLISIPTRPK